MSRSMWDPKAFTFDMLDDLSSDPTVTIIVGTPVGRIYVMADFERVGSKIILRSAHINGELGVGPNTVGLQNLKVVAREALPRMGCHELEIEGATRTTGAGPGRPRHPFGSAGEVRLVPAGAVRKASAAFALVARGLSMREARDAVGTMVERGEVTVTLPTIEDRHALAGELTECGIAGDIRLQPAQSRPQIRLSLPEGS